MTSYSYDVFGDVNKTGRTKTYFTTYADMYVLAWVRDSPDQLEAFLRNGGRLVDNTPEPNMPIEQQRAVFLKMHEQYAVMQDNDWAYTRAIITGQEEGCFSLYFLRKAMDIHITDSRHNASLNVFRSAVQKGLAYGLSPDAPAMAAPWGTHDKKGQGQGKYGSTPTGGSNGTPKGWGNQGMMRSHEDIFCHACFITVT